MSHFPPLFLRAYVPLQTLPSKVSIFRVSQQSCSMSGPTMWYSTGHTAVATQQATQHRPRSTGHAAQATQHRPRSTGHTAQDMQYRPRSTGHAAQATQHRPRSTGHTAQDMQYRPCSTGHTAQDMQYRPCSTGHAAQVHWCMYVILTNGASEAHAPPHYLYETTFIHQTQQHGLETWLLVL